MARQDVLLIPRLARVGQHRRHRDLIGRRQRHERDEVRNDVDVGVQRVDRRVRAVREQRPHAAEAGLDKPAVVAQKTVEKDRYEAAVNKDSTMLQNMINGNIRSIQANISTLDQ